MEVAEAELRHTARWAPGAVVYQIYPRSFKDSDGDGVGDLPGITSKLDYLQDLGVDAVWLSPFYTSPMADYGYDVADYCDVDPTFGNLDDAKELIAEAHERDIKVMVDLVPNHTSSAHEWFKASSDPKHKDHEKYKDWYVWHDPVYDEKGRRQPPNNWINVFSGESSWEWNEQRKQYYLHSFDTHQPDLNWENKHVQKAIQNVMRFWLRHGEGVDGFRVDAVPFIAKDPMRRDEPDNPNYKRGKDHPYNRLQHDFSVGTAQLYEHLQILADVLAEPEFADRHPFMVTEGYPVTPNHIKEYLGYYDNVDPHYAAPFNFEPFDLGWGKAASWRKELKEYYSELHKRTLKGKYCIAATAGSNHDNPRPVSRLGYDQARAFALLLLTLPGMVFIYNGDEIGMHDVEIPKGQSLDPSAAGGYDRDPERTPFQWGEGTHADFTDGKSTWLPVAKDYKKFNVAVEKDDTNSMHRLYKNGIELRHNSSAMKHVETTFLDLDDINVLGYVRHHGDDAYLTLVNMNEKAVEYTPEFHLGNLAVSSIAGTETGELQSSTVKLRPREAAVYKVSDWSDYTLAA